MRAGRKPQTRVGRRRSGDHAAVHIVAGFHQQSLKIGNVDLALALKRDDPVILERRDLAADGFKGKTQIIGRLSGSYP